MTLKSGDQAPDFTLKDQHGAEIRLQDLLARGPLVLFFYPADNTPICTRESCAFRDAYTEFSDQSAEIVGVSRDSVESHSAFAERNALPYSLLADTKGTVHNAYGAITLGGLLPKRVTFVIDQQGVIRHVYSAQLQARRHVNEALDSIKGF